MSQSRNDPTTVRRTSDGMLVAIPIFAMMLVIFPIGPIGAPAGLLLSLIGLLLAYGRAPSKNRTNLIACSIMALIGTGVFTVVQVIDWLG